MKNKFNYLVALTFLLSSCGTANYYSSGSYDDPAYYRPGTEVKVVRNVTDETTDQELQALKEKTREVIVVDENSGKTILPLSKADTVFVDINEYDSFEELLTKFNSPEYQIQVIVAEDDENWSYRWYWNNPYYYWNYAWGRGFGNPYFYGNYGYGNYGFYCYPGYYSYWDPWYYPGYYGFYDYYGCYYGYNGYYGHFPYYGIYDNWYYWWGGSGRYHDQHYGNIASSYFYGRRGSDERDTGNGTPSSGSYSRRSTTDINQIRGYNTSNKNTYQGTKTSESLYRRDNTQNRLSNGAVYNQNVVSTRQGTQRSGSGTSYTRASNGGERSSTSYRAPARQTNEGSSNLRSTNYNRTTNSTSTSSTRSEYQRNNTNYSQQTRHSSTYPSAGSSAGSSEGTRSSSSSGSVYRR